MNHSGSGIKRILLLGGNRYNVPAIRAAQAAGFFVMVADRNPGASGMKVCDESLPFDITDPGLLIPEIEKRGGVDGIVSMAEAGVRCAASVSSHFRLPSISLEAAENATSKVAMRRLWETLGPRSLPYRCVRDVHQASLAATELGFPLIFKPDRSLGGSRGVMRVENADEIEAAVSFIQETGMPGSRILVEPCVTGEEYSAEVLIWEDRVSLLCAGRKVKTAFPYRVDFSVQYPAVFSDHERVEVESMAAKAVRALGLTQGAAHIEFCLTPNGPVLFELAARFGGGHTPQIARHVSGVDEFIEVCRMACGAAPAGFKPERSLAAEYRFLVFPPGRVAAISVPPAVAGREEILDAGVTLHPGEEIRPVQTTSDRSGFVVVCAGTRDEAETVADWACREISVRYEDGREAHAETLASFLRGGEGRK